MALIFVTVLMAVLAQAHTTPTATTLDSTYGPDLLQLTSASSTFSELMHNEVATNQPNAIFSPFSAHACLSMAYLGARGTTATKMASALQLSGTNPPHTTYHDLIEDLNSATNVKLLTANGIFVNPTHPIHEDYKKDVMDNYFAISQNIDMNAAGGPEAPINTWVAGKTENKISSILPPNTIKDDTAMILINTIFFNGTWAETFEEYMTSSKPFSKSDDSTTQVNLMHQTGIFSLKKEAIPNVDVIRIPFKNRRFAMYIALPKTNNGMNALENYVTGTSSDLDAFFKNMEPTPVDLHLPKFKLTSTMTLNKALSNMGMTNAFSDQADFSGISDVPMKITKVVQKAMIEVQETGTVAVAATGLLIRPLSLTVYSEPPFLFKADHPFLFFLRDDNTEQILFQGKFADPDNTEIIV